MKKINLVIMALFFLAVGSISAQTASKDYFVGKWSVLAVGTPGGDSKLVVDLKRIKGKLTGVIFSEGEKPKEIIETEEQSNSVKVYFRHNLFKVNLLLVKKDDNNVNGSLMSKYKSKGLRIK
jgi:hypothetical protein